METARELFVHRLQTMLWVEQTLADEILPMLRDHVHAIDLKHGLERHELETREHVRIVKTVLHLLGEQAEPVESAALVGMKAEHDLLMAEIDLDRHDVVDLMHADVIAANEHLEIAAYTWLRSTANQLGEEEIALRLQGVLEQEQYALELTEKALAKVLAEHVANA